MVLWCRSPFWDKNITYSPYPYLTECFRNTALQWMPIGLFWFLLPVWIYTLLRKPMKTPMLPVSKLFVVKLIFAALFLLVQIVRFIDFMARLREEQDRVFLLTSALYASTAITILWLVNYDRVKGIYSSGILFTFWLCVTVASVPDVIHYSLQIRQHIKWVSMWIASSQLILALGSFVANCFAEKSSVGDLASEERPVVPELYVSFPSRLFYNWVTPLIMRGYKEPLKEKDCWELPSTEQTTIVVNQVQTTRNRSIRKSMNHVSMQKPPIDQHNGEYETFIAGKTRSQHMNNTPFWRILFRTYSDKLIAGGSIKLMHDLLQFCGPMILKLLINFFNNTSQPTWLGLFYALLLSMVVFGQIILLRAHFQCQFIVGLRFRAAITGLVYRKSLKLSNASKQETTTGEVVNLMAIDAARFAEITPQLHTLWTGPLQLIIALLLLYQQMKWAILPGVGLLLIMVPINLYLQRIQKRLTSKQMIVKDQRIKTMNEILNGIRVLKLYAWEMAFIRSITHIRKEELKYIRQKAIVSALTTVLWAFTPILVGIATFATYVLSSSDHILTADKAFVSLALFNLLRGPLVAFPNVISTVVEARVSNKRIEKFLNYEEIDPHAVEHVPIGSDGNAIVVEDGSFHWSNGTDQPLILKNINFRIPQGSLVALVGPVGAGKSSILAALLGEMTKVEGHVRLSGTIAYVPQTAWVMNTTLRENILFGRDFNKILYDQVIEACALKQDIEMLPGGDETEIGEKGINLSGGQRQRVSLARALYSNTDLYLFDDPLSAVDAHVGAHIFRHVIGPKGLLRGKTRLLVTHGVSYLNKFDEIFVVSQGNLVDHGNYQELMKRSHILQEFVQSIEVSDFEENQRRASDIESMRSVPATPSELISNPLEVPDNEVQQDQLEPTSVEIQEKQRKLIEKEKIQTGSVKFRIFSIYIRACKLSLIALIILFFGMTISAVLASNIWLARWTDKMKQNSTTNQIHYMNVYSILGITQGCLTLFMQVVQKFAAYTASQKLHWIMLIGVLHAPMSFFDTTPIGRIINRFAKDIDSIDTSLSNAFAQLLTTLIIVIATLIILIYGSWLAIFELIPLAFLFAYIQRVYISTSRQLRRLDSVTRSSIYANFGETIHGLSSIRAYQVQQRFIDLSDNFINRNQSCHLSSSVCNRWLGIRLEMIANLLTLCTAITSVLLRDRVTAGTVGLMITYALQITHSLNLLVRVSSEIETNIVGVERIHEYAEITSEAPWDIPEKKPPPHWPMHGKIRIDDLSARYRENLPLVLKDLSIDIAPGEKIGIIGRTGSGKSSLCLALFRIIEPSGGTVIIDQVDIQQIGLHDLRSKITIIPQDAVIFAGSVRFNIDPFGHYSDAEIWTVLELVHMKERLMAMENGLSYLLAEGGQNLSAGERQLLCLARALLRKSKIFILDEATAAIDMETDRLIQMTIRSAFKDATVLTIAHRLHTILDSTKILVLANGTTKEYDAPKHLAEDPDSAFAKLLRDANIRPSDIVFNQRF